MKKFTRVCSAIAALALASCATVTPTPSGAAPPSVEAEVKKPGWVKYAEVEKGDVYRWSQARSTHRGEDVTIWQMVDFTKKDANGALSDRRLLEFDCRRGTYTVTEVTLHPAHMAEGEAIASDMIGSLPRHPAPDSTEEYLFDALCKK